MENAEVNKTIKFINSLPCANAVKIHGSIHRRGEPDVYASISGRCIVIEMKFGGGVASPLQEYRLECWYHAGALSFKAWTLSDVIAILEMHGYI